MMEFASTPRPASGCGGAQVCDGVARLSGRRQRTEAWAFPGLMALLCLFAGCGGDAWAPLAPVQPTPLAGSLSVGGRVLATQTGEAVIGASVTFTQSGTATVVTDGEGRFVFPRAESGYLALKITAPGFIERNTHITLTGPVADLALDVIRDAPPFSLAFYRQLARSSLGSAGGTATLNPWQQAPSFYIQSRTDDTGIRVPEDVINGIRRVVLASVPELSGGRWTVPAFESGEAFRPVEDGWVIVQFFQNSHLGPDALGRATIGGPKGRIELILNAQTLGSRPNCASAMDSLVEHEMVHIMGFFHTDNVLDDFHGPGCTGAGRPERVLHHAQIAYSRLPGNRDIDVDRLSIAGLTAVSASTPIQHMVTCRLP